MLDSLFKFFNNSKKNKDNLTNNEDLLLICGILLEAAAIDGKIDKDELSKIEDCLIEFFHIDREKSNSVIKECLNKVNEPNSFHYFTSKINKEFELNKKIKIIEMLWEIILIDGKIHDYESNLIRRLSGLLYVSNIDCTHAKQRAEKKIMESTKS